MGTSAARRLFVGIELDDATRTACMETIDRLQHAGFAARYEDPDKLHVTVAFLGNVAADRLPSIEAAIRAGAARRAAFSVRLDRVGAFPHERRPRIVYVGARNQGAAYRALAASMHAAYAELGFTFANDPLAHVTVARIKGGSLRPLPLVEMPPVLLRVDRLTLFESVFDRERNTSRYEALFRAPLNEA